MLKFSQSNFEEENIEIRSFRTIEFMEELINENKFLLRERDISYHTIFNSSMPEKITTDQGVLSQILGLLSKAVCRASSGGESIVLYCNSDDTNVNFHIRDNKTHQARENLYERFQRFDLDNASSNDFEELTTTMLGVIYAKIQAKKIGGEVTLHSTDEANNEIILSFSKIDLLSKDEIDNVLIEQDIFLASNYLANEELLTDDYKTEEWQNYKLLIGEDNADNAQVLQDFLNILNFETSTKCNNSDIMEAIKNNVYDGLILSNSMRHKNIVKLIREIRELKEFRSLPIIAIINKISKSRELELKNAGASLILLKPINFKYLAEKMKNFIEHSKY